MGSAAWFGLCHCTFLLDNALTKHEAVSSQDWIPIETFLNESLSIYEKSWSLTGAIGWVWRKLVEYSAGADNESLPIGRFVLKSNLEEAAAKILKRAHDVTSPYVGHIYSPETFAQTFSPLFPRPLSKLDQLVLLRHLSRDKKEIASSYNVPSSLSLTQTIKFKTPNKALAPITASDTAIAQLKSVQLSLSEQITLLTTQIETYTQKARDATSKKNRIVALSALRSRKLAESALEKRSDALSKIEQVLHGVEQAAGDAEIIKTLEGGATALERLNREIGGIDRVEKIMDRVRDGVEESEEVGKVIAELGAGRVDEMEVEEEFDELLKAAEEEERKKREMERLKEQAEREREEKAQRERGAEKTQEEEDGLVEEMKTVSLDPSPMETPQTEEGPIPA
jgi:charged multivesicular body protein 7